MTNPAQTAGIERADKRKGLGCRYFSLSRSGRISWPDWFTERKQREKNDD